MAIATRYPMAARIPGTNAAKNIFAIFCSVLNVVGNLSLSKAYQNAESSWLAPLDYSYLLFACIWGKIIFDTWPNLMNLIGILLITFGGILIAYRERVKNVV